jgi:hypothetical protein
MNRYSGVIGIRRPPVEVEPGIFEDVIEEVAITGSIYRRPARWAIGETAQDTLQMNQVISVVAPENIQNSLDGIVYATYQGRRWAVRSIEYNRPRLELSLGGTYNA